jgi:hypothetical protein
VSKIKAKSSQPPSSLSSQPPSSLSSNDATPGGDQSASASSATARTGSSGANCAQMHGSGVAATVSLFLEKCKGQVVLIKDMEAASPEIVRVVAQVLQKYCVANMLLMCC